MSLCRVLTILLAACLLASCQQADQTAGSAVAPAEPSYQKPGAAVRLGHDYDGASVPGETETLHLQFTERYADGLLRVSLAAGEGLLIVSGEGPYEFDLAGVGPRTLEISVLADDAGRYYLKIFAEVLHPGGRVERRVFSLALVYGEAGQRERPAGETKTDFRGDTLRVLPAQENPEQAQ